jgi:hypothetical protein
MATILMLLAAAVLSMAYVLFRGPESLEDSDDLWESAPSDQSLRRIHAARHPGTAHRGRHGDRRYHDVDCPVHRRRTDDIAGEI